MIVLSCFLQNMLMDGVINAFGVIYLEVTESFGASASQAAWILSIQTCMHGLAGQFPMHDGVSREPCSCFFNFTFLWENLFGRITRVKTGEVKIDSLKMRRSQKLKIYV